VTAYIQFMLLSWDKLLKICILLSMATSTATPFPFREAGPEVKASSEKWQTLPSRGKLASFECHKCTKD